MDQLIRMKRYLQKKSESLSRLMTSIAFMLFVVPPALAIAVFVAVLNREDIHELSCDWKAVDTPLHKGQFE
jgi:hypothetical protein